MITKSVSTLPVVYDGLSSYLREIKKFPMLSSEEEYMYAKSFNEHGDIKAAHKLVTSHLRLVAKMAVAYRHYGLPIADLISEGTIGLMQAVKKFNPDNGNRLSTYATWWIKAALNEYVLKSWSLVKMGTVAAQKRLFFNLRKIKAKLGLYDNVELDVDSVKKIASSLDVSEKEVMEMNRRMNGDASLNVRVGEEGAMEHQDLLVDDRGNQGVLLEDTQEANYRNQMLENAMKEVLNEREQDIIRKRRLTSPSLTLEALGQEYKVSKERIRQIENRAFEKLQEAVIAAAEAE
ncbi:MAG: RNA polymerase sigma factor RpoH [Alphaproteobacteria bacterium]|nr:RNA polymerase sigma factor RpoH [Alphaproteobacteria bacterium]